MQWIQRHIKHVFTTWACQTPTILNRRPSCRLGSTSEPPTTHGSESSQERRNQKQLDTHLQSEIVRPFKATAYSQLLLAVKPHTKQTEWRFCIDYGRLMAQSWPLPYTKHMFEGIESHRGRYFVVMDFNQVFHQLALSSYRLHNRLWCLRVLCGPVWS